MLRHDHAGCRFRTAVLEFGSRRIVWINGIEIIVCLEFPVADVVIRPDTFRAVDLFLREDHLSDPAVALTAPHGEGIPLAQLCYCRTGHLWSEPDGCVVGWRKFRFVLDAACGEAGDSHTHSDCPDDSSHIHCIASLWFGSKIRE